MLLVVGRLWTVLTIINVVLSVIVITTGNCIIGGLLLLSTLTVLISWIAAIYHVYKFPED